MSKLVIAAALVAAALCAVGCGGATAEEGNPVGVGPSSPTPPVPPPPTPGPTVSLAALSPEAKQFVLDHNINIPLAAGGTAGVVKRWGRFPIAVQIKISDHLRIQDLERAMRLWEEATNGKVTFVVSEAAAFVLLDTLWPPPMQAPDSACGVEGANRIENGGEIVSGFGHYAFEAKPECRGNGDHSLGLAHGLGHILGFGSHTSQGVMASRSTWGIEAVEREVVNFLYDAPIGARPEP